MGCNANNHPPDCRCGWGGDGHKGRSLGRIGGHSHLSFSERHIASKIETENSHTHCPICHGEVFFIKHNGGSVWLDPPLGSPWYKHACFDVLASNKSRKKLKTSYDGLHKSFSSNTKIIVISSCVFNNHSQITTLKAQFDDGETYSFSVKGDARLFVGKMCFIDPAYKDVWPVDDHNKKLYYHGSLFKHLSASVHYNDISAIGKNNNVKVPETKFSSKSIRCKICEELLAKQKNYRKHLFNVHGVMSLYDKGSDGFLVVDPDKFFTSSADFSDTKEMSPSVLENETEKRKASLPCNKDVDLKENLRYAFNACVNDAGWADLGSVGTWLIKQRPFFNFKNYGYKKLSLLVNDLDYIAVKKEPTKDHSFRFLLYIKFIS